jgi:peptide/nickel transport system permease protein
MTAASAGAPRNVAAPGALLPSRAVDDLIPDQSATKVESPRELAMRRLKENRVGQVAALVLLAIVVMCLSAPWFETHWAGRGANDQNLSGTVVIDGKPTEVVSLRGVPNVGPGFRKTYTMGADQLGRDIFMRVLEGGRISLLIGFGSALITMVLATLLGAAAGYYKGRFDMVVSRMFDVMLATPSLVLMIAVSVALAQKGGFLFIKRGSATLPLLVIGIFAVPVLGRILRSQALSLGEKEYVEAARALGAKNSRIIGLHVIPHLTTTLITYMGILVSANILMESALSFLGVGVLPPMASWGSIISDGRVYISVAAWIAFFPGLMIVLTVVSLNLVGEALEDAFDPKSGGR